MKKKVRSFWTVALLILFSASCDNSNEAQGEGSEYIIVSAYGNISLYDYSTKHFLEQLYTIPSAIYSSNKKGNYVYMSTDNFSPGERLRKVDVTTGVQVSDVKTWFHLRESATVLMDFHHSNIVTCNVGSGHRFYIKRYNENLSLQDSIVVNNVQSLSSMGIADDKLFCSIATNNNNNTAFQGHFLKVMDLNTGTFIKSIQTTSPNLIVPLGSQQILLIQPDTYSIMDVETLEITDTKSSSIGGYAQSFDIANNVLYFIRSKPPDPSGPSSTLFKVNLSDGIVRPVGDVNKYTSGPTLYDPKAKVIVCGSGPNGGFIIFSENGKVLRDVESPIHTSQMFIK